MSEMRGVMLELPEPQEGKKHLTLPLTQEQIGVLREVDEGIRVAKQALQLGYDKLSLVVRMFAAGHGVTDARLVKIVDELPALILEVSDLDDNGTTNCESIGKPHAEGKSTEGV